MKFKKTFIVLIALLIISCLCLNLAACTDSPVTTPPTPPDGGFENPGDNLGGGGTGSIPSQVESLNKSGISVSDLTELSKNISSDGATIIDGTEETLTITAAGNYILKGEFKTGVVVNVANGETTHLFLDSANISNATGIALSNTNKKSDLVITLISGSQNAVSNGGDDVNAIHIKGNLRINGSGSLSVTSQSKSAIKVSKTLIIVDSNLAVESQNHGISAKSIEIHNTTLTVNGAIKDGINAECDDDTTAFPNDYAEGYVILKNVKYTASVNGDGIQADTLVYIDGGNVEITTKGKFVSYSESNMATYGLEVDDYRYVASGNSFKKIASDSNFSTTRLYALAQSCKGIKVGEIKYDDEDGNEVAITDGEYLIVITGDAAITINSADDSIHVNSGDILIESGNLTLNTYDDGITADKLVQINGGNIAVESSYEGIEGAYVKITDGIIDIMASDDGINAASDDESVKEYIVIDGGNIIVDADGDGLDSNGSILITGGEITVYGPTSNGDGALDAETGIIIQGGTIAALGSLGMVETPSSNSTQNVLSYAQNSIIQAGETLYVKDANNNTIMTIDIRKNCQSIILSSPNLETGATYTLANESGNLTTFTISSIITTVGSQGFGPSGMQPGGGQEPPSRP